VGYFAAANQQARRRILMGNATWFFVHWIWIGGEFRGFSLFDANEAQPTW
jgi:hypothetical protein